MRHVVDCSVVLKWYFQEPLSDVALGVLGRFQTGDLDLLAPDSLVPELGHSLRRLVLGGKLSIEDSYAALEEFAALPITLVSSLSLSRQAMELAVTHMAAFYDALYLALAVSDDCRVLTADERMVKAFATLDRTLSLAQLA